MTPEFSKGVWLEGRNGLFRYWNLTCYFLHSPDVWNCQCVMRTSLHLVELHPVFVLIWQIFPGHLSVMPFQYRQMAQCGLPLGLSTLQQFMSKKNVDCWWEVGVFIWFGLHIGWDLSLWIIHLLKINHIWQQCWPEEMKCFIGATCKCSESECISHHPHSIHV